MTMSHLYFFLISYFISTVTVSADLFPYDIVQCDTTPALTTTCLTESDYDCIENDIRALVDSLPSTCEENNCSRGEFTGCVLRFAGHDFMDYVTAEGTGGSNGCLNLSDIDNKGLEPCLTTMFVKPEDPAAFNTSLQSVYAKVCASVSLADFIVIAAQSVMSMQSTSGSLPEFKSNFKYGRTTATSCSPPPLPDPEGSCPEVERVYNRHMGLDWTESAALMGVHTLGRTRTNNSGYNGWWSSTGNQSIFNNNYFTSLIARGWRSDKAVGGNPLKNQWMRTEVDGFVNGTDAAGHKQMMLNTDLCLVHTQNSLPLDAAVNNCCAWVASQNSTDFLTGFPSCGNGDQCCGNESFFMEDNGNFDCGDQHNPKGPAAAAVRSYHASEAVWLADFFDVWKKSTENGYTTLSSLASDGSCPSSQCVEISGTDTPTANPVSAAQSMVMSSGLLFALAFNILS